MKEIRERRKNLEQRKLFDAFLLLNLLIVQKKNPKQIALILSSVCGRRRSAWWVRQKISQIQR